MPRPDQPKFDLFSSPFLSIDEELERLANDESWDFHQNYLRQPGRVLDKPGNPNFLIDLSYDDYWAVTEFSPGLPLSLMAIAYFDPPEDPRHTWRLSETVVRSVPFEAIRPRILEHFASAMRLAEEWTAERIMQAGERSENLRLKYGDLG